MKTHDKPKEHPTAIITGPVNNDFSILQHHVKQLEAQIKRLAEAVRANRVSAID